MANDSSYSVKMTTSNGVAGRKSTWPFVFISAIMLVLGGGGIAYYISSRNRNSSNGKPQCHEFRSGASSEGNEDRKDNNEFDTEEKDKLSSKNQNHGKIDQFRSGAAAKENGAPAHKQNSNDDNCLLKVPSLAAENPRADQVQEIIRPTVEGSSNDNDNNEFDTKEEDKLSWKNRNHGKIDQFRSGPAAKENGAPADKQNSNDDDCLPKVPSLAAENPTADQVQEIRPTVEGLSNDSDNDCVTELENVINVTEENKDNRKDNNEFDTEEEDKLSWKNRNHNSQKLQTLKKRKSASLVDHSANSQNKKSKGNEELSTFKKTAEKPCNLKRNNNTRRSLQQLKLGANSKAAQRNILTEQCQAVLTTGGGPEEKIAEVDPDVTIFAPNLLQMAPTQFSSDLSKTEIYNQRQLIQENLKISDTVVEDCEETTQKEMEISDTLINTSQNLELDDNATDTEEQCVQIADTQQVILETQQSNTVSLQPISVSKPSNTRKRNRQETVNVRESNEINKEELKIKRFKIMTKIAETKLQREKNWLKHEQFTQNLAVKHMKEMQEIKYSEAEVKLQLTKLQLQKETKN